MGFADDLEPAGNKLNPLQRRNIQLINGNERLQNAGQNLMLVHRSIPTGNVPNSAPMLIKGGRGEILIPQVLQQIERGGRPFELQPPLVVGCHP